LTTARTRSPSRPQSRDTSTLCPRTGFDHIALFMPINATKPIWITSGEWR
jgi:dipeptidyl aminopeptidase